MLFVQLLLKRDKEHCFYMIRKSTINDIKLIKHLISLCFGNRDDLEPYNNIEGRYYLYFVNNDLVAMTGLSTESDYGHLEIDWTCTHPDYRHKGIMQELFSEMLQGVNDDIYCSCWRLSEYGKPNLYAIMSLFDFKEVIHQRVCSKVPYNCFRNGNGNCVYCMGIGCECYEDLYLRTKKKRQS